MSRPEATPAVQPAASTPTRLVTGEVLVGLAAEEMPTAAETKRTVKIAPRGRHTVRDGRSFEFDPDLLIERFRADGVDLPLDMDHSISLRAKLGMQSDAVGWISNLTAREDGLYGDVEFLQPAMEALSARSHRYLSPTIFTDETGRAVWLHSVALVAAPALSMPAVASAQDGPGAIVHTKPETSMKTIAEALGLQPDANEASMLSAISTMQSGHVAKPVHDETLATLAATKTQLEALQASVRTTKVDALLDKAVADKKIAPAEREPYAALCATDAGFEQIARLIEARPAMLQASGLDGRVPQEAGHTTDPDVLASQAIAWQAEQARNGVTVSIAAAVSHVAAAAPSGAGTGGSTGGAA